MAEPRIRPLPETFDELIDFAGIFPPAAMTPADAMRDYRHHRAADHRSIVGGLAWTVSTFDALAELIQPGEAVEVCAIGRPSTDWDSWQQARDDDAKAMTALLDRFPGAEISTYEWKLPSADLIDRVLPASKGFAAGTDVFIELDWSHDLSEPLAAIAESDWARVKYRTGGTVAAAYPTSQQLAGALKGAVDLELEFKLTAGLHEPVAHFEPSYGVHAHGFLNILAAVSLIYHAEASLAEVASVLDLTDASACKWGSGLELGGHHMDAAMLDDCRSFFRSFGSCSIDEPVAGLSRLAPLN